MARYRIIIEADEHNYCTYDPDLSGCVSTGRTREEVLARTREAITMHLEGMREDGENIPEPNSDPAFVEVDVPADAHA